MTAKHGTQWKTSWRRQKPSIGAGQPVPMWFFRNNGGGPFSSFVFRQPLTTPSVGDGAPPFWVGMIAGSDPSVAPLPSTESAGVFRTSAWQLFLNHSSPASGLPAELSVTGEAIASSDAILVDPLSPPLSPITLRAVVAMLVVTPVVGGNLETLWIDGSVRRQSFVALPYVPGNGLNVFDPGRLYLNSMAGGNALPTAAEIKAWFSATRYASPFPAAQPIPGKTLDRYDAGATPAVVPNPLVNLAGGQNAPLVLQNVPVPANLLVPATFGY
jgi:hypothetical protein